MFQHMLDSSLERRQGRTYGPAGGKSGIVIIDDLGMPARNEWGDQETNELVRQVIDQSGYYRLKKPIGDLKNLVDVDFILVSGQDRSQVRIPERLKQKLCPIMIDEPYEGKVPFAHVLCIIVNLDTTKSLTTAQCREYC